MSQYCKLIDMYVSDSKLKYTDILQLFMLDTMNSSFHYYHHYEYMNLMEGNSLDVSIVMSVAKRQGLEISKKLISAIIKGSEDFSEEIHLVSTMADWRHMFGVEYFNEEMSKNKNILFDVLSYMDYSFVVEGHIDYRDYMLGEMIDREDYKLMLSDDKIKSSLKCTLDLNSFKPKSKEYGEVYFLLSEELSRVKVGVSKNARSRISNIRTSCHSELETMMIIAVKGYKDLEKYIHKKLEEFRHRGEWFNVNKLLLSKIIQELNAYILDIKFQRPFAP